VDFCRGWGSGPVRLALEGLPNIRASGRGVSCARDQSAGDSPRTKK
jgi:hypothetical protein